MLLTGTKAVLALGLLSIFFTLAGCGGPERPEMAPVSGTVLFDGKPLADVEVVFRNDISPRFGSGKTNAEGKFQLTTFENFDGAVLGDYKVTVTKVQLNEALTGNVSNPTANYGAGMMAAASGKIEMKSELPAKYADPKNSGLTATVTKEGPNDFTFKLDKQ